MRAKEKLVSIIINCYNGEKYLEKTLNSIINQKYKNFEVIFIDNCSTDRSSNIFKKIKDKRFKYFKTKKKLKLYDGRNFALKKCNGDFITFIDTDDWWDKRLLSSRKQFFHSNKEVGFCFSNCFHYYESRNQFKIFYKNKLPSGYIMNDLLKFYFVKMGSIILKKKIIFQQKFNNNYNIIGDFDYIIRISKKFKAMAFNDLLVNIRIHESNFTHNNRKMFYEEFNHWINSQDFSNPIFLSNKSNLYNKLEYLRLIYQVLNQKSLKMLIDIFRYPLFYKKIKLLILFFSPSKLLEFMQRF